MEMAPQRPGKGLEYIQFLFFFLKGFRQMKTFYSSRNTTPSLQRTRNIPWPIKLPWAFIFLLQFTLPFSKRN